eukprot:TRINITY_DN18566_c0_g1_i1.p1 TRINITY_DN18566_c0_g1~~TRINITY_DN18566_c0_g1_i1.p1  ORF type:complete len:244 (+),score=6.52 TRINITY_DN18566_c0_g1_i1:80-733(+)
MEYRLKKEISSVEKETFGIMEVIDSSVKKFEDTRGAIEIRTKLDRDAVLRCSKDGFEDVVDNLISNAIKYNKPDGVVHVELKNSLLCIKDSGKGIDTKNLFDVFERYYQDDVSSEGVGIGLSIVKEFCDENSIKINIDSRVDVGSSFCLDLSSIISKAKQWKQQIFFRQQQQHFQALLGTVQGCVVAQLQPTQVSKYQKSGVDIGRAQLICFTLLVE